MLKETKKNNISIIYESGNKVCVIWLLFYGVINTHSAEL